MLSFEDEYIFLFDMNDINEIVVNTLMWMKNNLSSALVFERDYKINEILSSVNYKNEVDYWIRFSYGKYFKTKRDVV